MTIRSDDDLRAMASQIAGETNRGANTAARVGGLMLDMVDSRLGPASGYFDLGARDFRCSNRQFAIVDDGQGIQQYAYVPQAHPQFGLWMVQPGTGTPQGVFNLGCFSPRVGTGNGDRLALYAGNAPAGSNADGGNVFFYSGDGDGSGANGAIVFETGRLTGQVQMAIGNNGVEVMREFACAHRKRNVTYTDVNGFIVGKGHDVVVCTKAGDADVVFNLPTAPEDGDEYTVVLQTAVSGTHFLLLNGIPHPIGSTGEMWTAVMTEAGESYRVVYSSVAERWIVLAHENGRTWQVVTGTSAGSPATLDPFHTSIDTVIVQNYSTSEYIQLPDPATCTGLSIRFACTAATSAHAVTLKRHAGEMIDGATSDKVISTSRGWQLVSEGANWFTFGEAPAS